MSLIYKRKKIKVGAVNTMYDYWGEMRPFIRRIEKKRLIVPLVILKTIEWSIYRWYKSTTRRFYGIKGNELIYMITRRCSDKCQKCGIWETPEANSEHLKISYFLKCLNALHHNLYQVTLTGGEPLMFIEDVLLIAEEAYKLKVPMYIVTNGTLINESFLRRYSEYGHVLVVSIDTLNESKWKEFRRQDNYKKVMDNLILAKEILGKNLKIQSVLAHETQNEIPLIKEFCKKNTIQHTVQPYMDFGGSWRHTKQNNEVKNEIECAARKNICIYPNGDVVKCFDHHRIPIAREPIGNIGNEDIITILCKKRSTEISKVMKTCNYPCKYLSCNLPATVYN